MRLLGLSLALLVSTAACGRVKGRVVGPDEIGVEAASGPLALTFLAVPPGEACQGVRLPTHQLLNEMGRMEVFTADGVYAGLYFEVLWRVDPKRAVELAAAIRCVGTADVWRVVRHHVRSSAHQDAATYSLQELAGSALPAFLGAVLQRTRKDVPPGVEIVSLTLARPPSIGLFLTASRYLAARRRSIAQEEAAALDLRLRRELSHRQSEAEINRLYGKSLTHDMVELERARRWDGKMPTNLTTTGNGPFAIPYQ